MEKQSCAKFVDGIQHVGIPTLDLEKSIAFYAKLGFDKCTRAETGTGVNVGFVEIGSSKLEIYQGEGAEMKTGAINHVALNVVGIEDCFKKAQELKLTILSKGVEHLPFWKNGISYFIVEGPNKERIEFFQINP